MKVLGEEIFAKGTDGQLLSRIGTLFFRTPGLVTKRGIHAMQRLMWIDEVNADLVAAGHPPLTPAEEEAEMEQSVDLIFTDDLVLIRPDPERMDLAVRADEVLRAFVPKRRIRYLNTNSVKVRQVLCERGENWRMARHPISQEDMIHLIEGSRVTIGGLVTYYYNHATGTRHLTAASYDEVAKLPDADYRAAVAEIVQGLGRRNRLGQPEIELFPQTTPIEIRRGLRALALDDLSDAELRRAVDKLDADWRMAIPGELREESTANYAWRNELCFTITRQPNDTNAEEQELVAGISPEFYRQIEWLPGARIVQGAVIFDEVWEPAERARDPELEDLCDNRVKSLIFNLTRLFGTVDFINVGRIAQSLARHPVRGSRRGDVYLVQYREFGSPQPTVMMIRFQKWGVAERLDEGKDLLKAIQESDEYSDYILDRRLMCRQFGMRLPKRIGYGHFTEQYRGTNAAYNGVTVRTAYFVRPYICGTATDKVPPTKFRNPAFALAFARLLGAAAAIDLIVGRRSSVTGEMLFDGNYEVLRTGADGLPSEILVTDHAGSFVDYEGELVDSVAKYARAVVRRRDFVSDYPAFAAAYAQALADKVAELQSAYRARRSAFDGLFKDRPYDTNGSGAYRWARALARLERADPAVLKAKLLEAAGC